MLGTGPIGAAPLGTSGTLAGASFDAAVHRALPAITLKAAILDLGRKTDEGRLVRAVTLPWFDIVKMLQKDPRSLYQIHWSKWEEIIAGAYKREGFDEVILTSRSGDKGRDVIATRWGIGSIRFFDQVKAYSPGHLVPADEVRSMIGVIHGCQNVTKGVFTTTSEFAPQVREDPTIKPFVPFKLELKSRDDLLAWLAEVSEEGSSGQ